MKMNILASLVLLVSGVSANAAWTGTRFGTEPVSMNEIIHCEGQGVTLDFKYYDSGSYASYNYTVTQEGHCPSRNCGSSQTYTYSGSTDEAGATAKLTTNFTRAPGVNYLLTLTNKQEPQKNFSVAFHQYEDQSIGVSSVGIGGAVVNTAGLQCVEQ